MRHDSVKHVIGDLLRMAGHKSVEEEPSLQPLPAEMQRRHKDGSVWTQDGDEARLDVAAVGVWGPLQRAFFDVRVTNPLAPSYAPISLQQHIKNQEQEKKRSYTRRVLEVEKGSFTPLIFTVAGSCGKECDALLKRLAVQIAHKTGDHQSTVMCWIRTRLSYTLIRANTISLRGPHIKKAARHGGTPDVDYQVVRSEARLAF